MTEREISDGEGFLFGGMTDDSSTASAPPAVREPETVVVAPPEPVFLSRRELRAAGGYDADVAAPASPSAPATDVAAVFGFALGEAAADVAPAAPSAERLNAHRAAARIRPSAKRSGSRRPRPRADRTHDRRRVDRGSDDAPKSLRQRLFGVGVMVLVGGLFAVLALPAYADNDATALTASAVVQTQKVAVAGAAASTITTTARDSYTATSASDLRALYANALRQQAIEAYLQSGAKAKGDDYPWYAEPTRAEGGGLSPLGYYYRECVDFVAWRLNRDAGASPNGPFPLTWSYLTPNGGDGHDWPGAWKAHGWATGTTPKPGAVAWFFDNHVGYVNGILDDGQVLIEEYNYTPHAYSQRVINPDQAFYLYAPPLP